MGKKTRKATSSIYGHLYIRRRSYLRGIEKRRKNLNMIETNAIYGSNKLVLRTQSLTLSESKVLLRTNDTYFI